MHQELFRRTIDWKFFNYLKDRVTTLEDVGFILHLHVDAKIKNDTRMVSVYVYDSNIGDHYVENNFDRIDNDNLEYEYTIYTDTPAITHENKKKIEMIWSAISPKCELLYKSDAALIVIPKN